MSLILCPECRHEVSNVAAACPNCGRPLAAPPVVQRRVVVADVEQSEFPKWLLVPIVIAGAVLVFFAIALLRNNSDETANSRVAVNVAVPQKSQEIKSSTSRTETEPNHVTIPSSSTVVTPPSATSVPQTVAPSTQTDISSVPTDRGLVIVDAKITSKSGAIQSVKNEKFYLLDEDLETILSDADLEAIEGQSLSNSFGMAILYPEQYADFSRNALAAIKKHIKYNAITDATGKASMKDVKPDSYYLFGITKTRTGFAVWSSPVNIIGGENKLNLSPARLNEMSE